MQEETFVTEMGVSINPAAQKTRRNNVEPTPTTATGGLQALSPSEFAEILHRRIHELGEGKDGGSTRWDNVGST